MEATSNTCWKQTRRIDGEESGKRPYLTRKFFKRCSAISLVKNNAMPRMIGSFLFNTKMLVLAAMRKSPILELKGGKNEIFSLRMMFKKVKSFIYEKNYFSDRVPLR